MLGLRHLSIKGKITAVAMLTSGVALLAACGVLVAYEVIEFRKTLVMDMSTLAEITGKNCVVPTSLDRPDEAENILANLSTEKQVQAACIFKDKKIWARYPKNLADNSFPSAPDLRAHHFENGSLSLARAIIDPDKNQLGTLYVRSSLDTMYSRLGQYVGIILVVLVAASVIALLISARLQRVISGPLLELSDTARVVSDKKDYGVRAQKHNEDEVGVLIDSFNEMLTQIQKRDLELQEARLTAERANQAKSNFLSFMSHELRTPLTAIIGFSEMLVSDVEAAGHKEWVEDLRRVHDSGKYLLELINDILDISKIEAGKMEVHL
jgi:signal transduction histidine kinase